MKIRSLAIASLFVLPALLGATETNIVSAVASDSGSDTNSSATVLEEITITSTRIATPQEKSPNSVTVITREQIEQSQQHLVADVLRGQPGVEVARTGTSGALETVFLRGANGNQTLVLVDGIRVNNPFNNQCDFSQLPVDNVERIEILRGPQSTLYGSEASGGVVNIITQRGTCLPAGWVESEYGSFNTFETRGGISGCKGKFSLAANAGYTSSDNDRTNSNYRQYQFDGHARYDFSDKFSATLLATYFNNNDGTPGDIFANDPDARLKTESALIDLTLNADLTDWWNAKLKLSHSRECDNYDSPANAANFFTDYFSKTVASRDQVDFQNVFKLSEQHTILAGGTFESASGNLSSYGTYGPSALDKTIDTRSAYAQYNFTPVERLTFTGGGRVDDSSSFGTHATYRFGARATAPRTETIFRASVGTGFRAPSISDLYYPYFGNPNLKPEESLGWDAGFEQPLLENKLRFGATFFHNDFDNLIQYVGSPYFAPENIGRARTFGVETFVAWQVLTNLTARGSYTWLNTEDLGTGAALVRRPEQSGSLSLNWQITPKLDADASALFIGTRSDVNYNTYPASTVELPFYAKLNLAVRWQVQKHLELFARAENLTDERYQEVFGFPALGRGFYGGLRLQF